MLIVDKQTASSKPTKESGSSLSAAWRNPSYWLALTAIIALAAVLYGSLSGTWPKFNRAEVFFAECAREMLRDSNFVTPLYHGKGFFDKPILTYWAILAAFKLWGTTHLVARIPSIVCALGTAVITACGAAALFGIEAGLLSAMILCSSFMFLSFSALCMSDMMLVFFDTATLALFFSGTILPARRNWCFWLASVSMGLAFLTKGPVGIVLPGISCLAYLAITRQLSIIQLRHLLIGGVTAAILATPWFLAAFSANGAGAMYWFFVRENIQRFAGSTYDTHRPIWFMLTSLFTGFLPWSIFLPVILPYSIKKWQQPPTKQGIIELYLWLWIAVVTVFFSLSRGKIDYYVLPAYPAAAMLVGSYLSRWINSEQRPAVSAGWGLSVVLLLAGGISCVFLSEMSGHVSASQWLLMPASLITAGGLAVWAMVRKQYFQTYVLLFCGICLAAIGFSWQMLPVLVGLQPAVDYAAIIRKTPAATEVGMYKPLENWVDEVTFQTGREPRLLPNMEALSAFLVKSEPVYVMVPKDSFEQLPAAVMSQVRIIDSRPYISKSLTPGLAIKTRGHLTGEIPLLLVTNRK